MNAGDEQGEWNDPPGISDDDDQDIPEYPILLPDRYIYMKGIGSVMLVVGLVGLVATAILAFTHGFSLWLLIGSSVTVVVGFCLAIIHDIKHEIETQRRRMEEGR